MTQKEPIPIIVSARNRPIYLWNCLDSIYRFTETPHVVRLIDMASDDPLVAPVVDAFVRRGLIDEVKVMERNDSNLLLDFIFARLAQDAPYIAYIEADAVLLDSGRCWLSQMVSAMDADPKLAMLGSAVDPRDFVDMETAGALLPKRSEAQLRAIIKADTPERRQEQARPPRGGVFSPHNPAGRLMMLRTEALAEVGGGTDWQLHDKFCAAGYRTGILADVIHRHLSLLHIFDEPNYDYATRDEFMETIKGRQQG